ncbi:DHA2 family efflux MFS transporter permease subunit OS=Streptomyces alboniger OX=132473 GN=CP975_33435 PE=4 SV=1 [Streptomyces alboniger]
MLAPRSRASRPAPLSGPARTTVVLLFAAWFIDYADRLVINLVLPSIGDEFDLSHSQQGLVVSVFFVAYAACQIPGGILADRFGGRRMALWALAAWTVFTALTGLAWSFAVLLVMRVLFGLAQGVFPPAATKTLVERSRPQERMRANGLILSSNSLAAVFTPLAVAPLVAAFGWRSAYISIAALGVFVCTAMHLRLPAPLVEQRRPRSAAAKAGTAAAATAGTTADAAADTAAGSASGTRAGTKTGTKTDTKTDTKTLLKWGVLWRFAAMMFGYSLIIWGLSSWAPTYLHDERGLELSSAGALMAIPALAAALATVLGGTLVDGMGGRHRKILVPAMSVAAVALPVMAYASSVALFITLSTVAVFAAALCYMPIMAVPIRSLSAQHIGVASGILVFGGQLAGILAPSVLGLLADFFSFQVAFAFLSRRGDRRGHGVSDPAGHHHLPRLGAPPGPRRGLRHRSHDGEGTVMTCTERRPSRRAHRDSLRPLPLLRPVRLRRSSPVGACTGGAA